MRRGEVWWANLPRPWRRRPVLLLTRDEGYGLLTWVVSAPITTRVREGGSFVQLSPGVDHVPRRSVVNLDALYATSPDWLDARITRLSEERMAEVERAIHFALALKD